MRETLLKNSIPGNPIVKTRVADGMDEKEIILRAGTGDIRAFERLVSLYQSRVLSLAHRIVGNPDEARDVAQDVFIRLYRFLPQFKPGKKFFTWLYRIVVNASYDFLKKEGRFKMVSLDEVPIDTPALIQKEESSSGELNQIMEQLVETLSSTQKTVFILREVEELSHKEIARVLGCPQGTVRSHLHYARQHLKHLLEQHYPEFLEGI
jgi:RNA polymerase sigma-70 factor (ECF subfamily)